MLESTTCARLIADQTQGVADQIAFVPRPGILEHPLVRVIDLGELELERGL